MRARRGGNTRLPALRAAASAEEFRTAAEISRGKRPVAAAAHITGPALRGTALAARDRGAWHMTTGTLTSIDRQLRDRVMQQLAWDTQVDAGDIGAVAHDGVATLTGF